MYQALYRKYRPRCFGDVAGQEHITETLRRQIVSDRLSHAYLFVGTRGTGKTTCAKILSRAVNCMSPVEGEPCNKCMFCVGIEEGSILDVLELDAASNNSVDNVRELRDEAIYSPAVVKKRVYIVDEVHMLSLSAFNALLKILEEPPEHILFVLATTELHKVPATIQGRCQKFSFRRLSPIIISTRLKEIASKEGLTLTDEAAARISMLADGSMRDGISLLDQCISGDIVDLDRVQNTLGLAGQHELSRFFKAIADSDTVSALGILEELYNDGRDMASLLNELVSLFRDLLIFKISPDSGLLANVGFNKSELSELSKIIMQERLFFCIDVLKTAISGASRSGLTRLGVELCVIKICDERLSDDTGAILSRISRLEAGSPAPASSSAPVSSSVTAMISSPEPSLSPAVNTITDDPAEIVTEAVNLHEAKCIETDYGEEQRLTPGNENLTQDQSPCHVWSGILEILRGEPSVRVLLNDSSSVQAVLMDDSLTINFTDSHKANQVKHSFMDLIRDAAKSVLGYDVILHIEVVDSLGDNDNKRDGLESLSAFVTDNFDK